MRQRGSQLRIVLRCGEEVLDLYISGLGRHEVKEDVAVVGPSFVVNFCSFETAFCIDMEGIGIQRHIHPFLWRKGQRKVQADLDIRFRIDIRRYKKIILKLGDLGNVV